VMWRSSFSGSLTLDPCGMNALITIQPHMQPKLQRCINANPQTNSVETWNDLFARCYILNAPSKTHGEISFPNHMLIIFGDGDSGKQLGLDKVIRARPP
jgi:hypothetical protein